MEDVIEILEGFGKFFYFSPNAGTINYLQPEVILYGFIFIVLIIFGGFFILSLTKKTNDSIDILKNERLLKLNNSKINQGSKSLYRELIFQLQENQRYLVNIQPLTGNLAGYIGKVFSPETYVQKAFRSGIRAFILPVSVYKDDNKVPPHWPYSKKPAIVARDNNGSIISKNGMTIQKFCETLMLFSNENPTQADEPIILYIVPDGEFVPDKSKKEKDYVQLMTDIAKELRVIDKNRLRTIGQFGSAIGGKQEENILTQVPLTELRSKIIIFTTFDTSIYLKDKYKNITPTLHEYANFLPTQYGETGNTASKSRLLRLTDVTDKTTSDCRDKWCATLLKSETFVDPFKIDEASGKGVQSIPVDFFSDLGISDNKNINDQKLKDMNSIIQQWKGFAWRLKIQDTRMTKPARAEGKIQSINTNANGGKVSAGQ
jgi:hypothetical protein